MMPRRFRQYFAMRAMRVTLRAAIDILPPPPLQRIFDADSRRRYYAIFSRQPPCRVFWLKMLARAALPGRLRLFSPTAPPPLSPR
jgi:hypothetical protein